MFQVLRIMIRNMNRKFSSIRFLSGCCLKTGLWKVTHIAWKHEFPECHDVQCQLKHFERIIPERFNGYYTFLKKRTYTIYLINLEQIPNNPNPPPIFNRADFHAEQRFF